MGRPVVYDKEQSMYFMYSIITTTNEIYKKKSLLKHESTAEVYISLYIGITIFAILGS